MYVSVTSLKENHLSKSTKNPFMRYKNAVLNKKNIHIIQKDNTGFLFENFIETAIYILEIITFKCFKWRVLLVFVNILNVSYLTYKYEPFKNDKYISVVCPKLSASLILGVFQ